MLVREHLGLGRQDDYTIYRLKHPAFQQVMLQSLNEARMEVRQRNGDQHWPNWCEFRNRFANLPNENTLGASHTVPVLDAPFVAASIATRGTFPDGETVQSLRLCREFDPEWFNAAYPLALGLAVAQIRKSPS